jgi:hypothetical protein
MNVMNTFRAIGVTEVCRLQVGDTADFKSALRGRTPHIVPDKVLSEALRAEHIREFTEC